MLQSTVHHIAIAERMDHLRRQAAEQRLRRQVRQARRTARRQAVLWRPPEEVHPSARLDNTAKRKAELLVTGRMRSKPAEQHFCTTYRGLESGCGETGRYWEPRR
ncbi:MAG TPA: hypothetical protein VHF47_11120 [Acidimicrobiales bacterium]|nr:hypothetical protein [Acidimicrobiales bacterium]